MKERKYIYFSSDNSKDVYPTNSAFDFTVKLSDPLELPDTWLVALSEIEFTGQKSVELYVYCEFCESNNVLDQNLPILRRVTHAGEVERLYFMPLNNTYIDTVRVYIRDKNHKVPSVNIQRLSCTLILQKN